MRITMITMAITENSNDNINNNHDNINDNNDNNSDLKKTE